MPTASSNLKPACDISTSSTTQDPHPPQTPTPKIIKTLKLKSQNTKAQHKTARHLVKPTMALLHVN
jgi:hypothetical protein